MLGFLIGLCLLIGLPAAVLDDDPAESIGAWWELFAAGAIALAGAWLLGMLFVRTIGMAAFGLQIGGVVAAVLALIVGEAQYAPGMLFLAFVGWLIQLGQRARMGAAT